MQLDNPLWRYALSIYSKPSVEQACLAAQSLGLQVNTLLLCCWLATKGETYQQEDYVGAYSLWRDPVLGPLRQLRFQVKEMRKAYPVLDSCYQQLKQSELAAEQVDIACLWQVYQGITPLAVIEFSAEYSPEMLARQNMARYLNAVNMRSVTHIDYCNHLVDAAMLN